MNTRWGIPGILLLLLYGTAAAKDCNVEEILKLRDAGFSVERINEFCTAGGTATTEPAAPLRIIYFRSDKPTVIEGDSATLEWQTEGSNEVEISGVGAVEPSGTRVVVPLLDGPQYTLVARDAAGHSVSEELHISISRLMKEPEPTVPGASGLATPPRGDEAPGRPVLRLPATAGRLQPLGQDCIRVDGSRLELRRRGGRWLIVAGDTLLKKFGARRDEARQALRVLRHYRIDRQCFVGRPKPSLEYYLSGDVAPRGAMPGEDCIGIDPRVVEAQQIGGRWKIVEGRHWLMDFGTQSTEARQALRIIKRYGFTRQCFVGRPHPSLTYWRR